MANSTLDRLRTVGFALNLAEHGDRPALLTDHGEISYRDLAARVDEVVRMLGDARRLVLLLGSNTVDAVVTYLAALVAGHPVLLVPGDNRANLHGLIATYDPDVVAGLVDGTWRIEHQHEEPAHDLHADLALLLSTSGTTGSPKLVRLSQENLQSNAEAIAAYLDIRPDDRAATTLPMSYCYGLSVINSHLFRGAGIILTDLSVADRCFWKLFASQHGTSFAGVPYTFDLLDRVGFADLRLPSLRYVTQAGGKLAADRVARFAEQGRRDGWDLVVMYGQTEATARMAYLPPRLAVSRPGAIGVPIPGGAFRLEPVADSMAPGTGELVYSGPNVMLGYADSPADLALGRTIDELHTGDLARRTEDGLYELIGRRGQFAKICGLRVDPRHVETMLARHGVIAFCVGGDDELVVAVTGDPAGIVGAESRVESRVRRLVMEAVGLPAGAVRVHLVAEVPRLANGKPDYEAVRSPRPARAARGQRATRMAGGTDGLHDIYAQVLERPDVTDDSSFVGLGGDSLSYVEMSIRLEQALGHLPVDWHTTPIRDLKAQRRQANHTVDRAGGWARRAGRAAMLDTSVALRAVSIFLVVGTHAQLFAISGGAHLLLGVAGFNLARFHLTPAPRSERVTCILRGLRRIAIVSVLWIGLVFLLTNDYTLRQVLLLHYLIGPDGVHNHYWFIEAWLYISLGLCALLAVPVVDRLERRHPFALPMGLVALGLLTRYQLIPGVQLRTPAVVVWLVALGWAAAKASTAWHRVVVTLATIATVPGFFDSAAREAVVIVGLIALTWVPSLPSLPSLNRVAGLLAGASLYIYLVHWQVFPHLDQISSLLATVASLAAGIAFTALVRVTRRLPRWSSLDGGRRMARQAARAVKRPAE